MTGMAGIDVLEIFLFIMIVRKIMEISVSM